MFAGFSRQQRPQSCFGKKSGNGVKKVSAILVATVAMATGQMGGRAQDPAVAAAKPVLVELFTSEGCSSCPPADALLERMDVSQPIPGAQLIVLSEHVDYWDHDGWKDPYSSPAFTERQAEYVHALGLKTPYTPQIIVDGAGELAANGPGVTETLRNAAALPKVSVRITSVTVQGDRPAVLRGRAVVDARGQRQRAGVYAVIALDHAESQVLRGENSGKHLAHVAVVQEIKKIGKLEKGDSVTHEFEFKLKPGIDPTNLRLVVFVQASGPGRVLGTALRQLGKSAFDPGQP
jgi:hypothetical protein